MTTSRSTDDFRRIIIDRLNIDIDIDIDIDRISSISTSSTMAAPYSLSHELGTMFGFLAACILTVGVYYIIWQGRSYHLITCARLLHTD
jgi:hypothetical protein